LPIYLCREMGISEAGIGRELGVGTSAIAISIRIGALDETSGWKGNVFAMSVVFLSLRKFII
jgi:hypothetical protein